MAVRGVAPQHILKPLICDPAGLVSRCRGASGFTLFTVSASFAFANI
jgi:hypothetical protein